MTEPPGWELYRSFLEVVRHGSLSAAARALRLTQPTIGRHIEALEQSLGIALFTRSPQGLLPTSVSLDLVPHAQAMASAAEAMLRTASGEASDERGTLRLTSSEVIGVEVLPPMLARFREARPGIVLELAISNRNEDLLRHDADLAVRHVRPAQEALVARRIGIMPVGLYARRRYLDEHGVPATLADLPRHALVGWDRQTYPDRVTAESALGITPRDYAFRCDSDLGQLAAVRAGLGIGICQDAIAARDPDLRPVLPDLVRYDLEIWLAMHEDLRTTRRVRLLFDFLAEALGAYVAAAVTPGTAIRR